MRTGEAAKYLGIGPQTLRTLADSGKIPMYVFGNRGDRRFRKPDLNRFIETH